MLIVWTTAPVDMLTSQRRPEYESPVQKSVPFGSTATAKSWPWHPGREAHE